VIVPVRNGERFLGECLDSVLSQEEPGMEVVVVDDGSTDASAAIAEAIAGVRVIRRSHEGLAPTRNAGVAAARAPLIAFCDADDTWKPGKLRRQLDHLAEHPDCDIALARMEHHFEPGSSWPAWLRRDQVRGDLDGVAMASGLYRRSVFERVDGFRVMPGCDFDLVIRARTSGCQITVLEDILLTRRIHDTNMMTTTGEGGAGQLTPAVREHMRKRRAHG
jgi:glycosyltransferase involved in cell wall biosynthesis